MMTADRRKSGRLWIIAGVSLVLHVLVLAWLARPAPPNLLDIAPDLALLSVELLRAATPDATPERAVAPTQMQRAVVRPSAPASVAPENQVPASVPTVAPTAGTTATAPLADNVRAALRSGAGCVRRSGSQAERDKCHEQFGRLTASTPSYDAPMDAEKRAYYDAVAAAGPSGQSCGDPTPGAVTPDHVYLPFLKCSVKFGAGRAPKDRQGAVRLGRSPCVIPLQGSFFTPEASVRKR